MSSENQTLYIKGSRDVEVTKPDVTLGDILTMECSDKKLLPKIKTIRLLKFHGGKQQRCAVSVLKIIECIRQCDVRSKGVNNASVSDGELLRELIYQILH